MTRTFSYTYWFTFSVLLTALCVPLLVRAQSAGVSTHGILSCSQQNGASINGVGAFSATQGIYVPVNDAAVTLNSGTLVYKECLLRVIVDNIRQAEASGYVAQTFQVLLHGRTDMNGNNGQPLFSVSLHDEGKQTLDKTWSASIDNGTFDTLNPVFRDHDTMKRAVLYAYVARMNNPGSAYQCPYTENLDTLYSPTSNMSPLDALGYLQNPACVRPYAQFLVNERIQSESDARLNDMYTRLNWYNGWYGKESTNKDGDVSILTPGTFSGAISNQAVTSGYRQLENANDIGQVVGSYFADVGAQVLSDNQGLANLTKVGGYLDQVAQDSNSSLVGSVVNAALTIVQGMRATEKAYSAAMQGIATTLTNSSQQLQSGESNCWTQIISKVCVSTSTNLAATGTCTDSSGATLSLSTSTAFSAAVVGGQITPLLTAANANVQQSNSILAIFDKLIANLQNTASTDVQRAAIQAVDRLASSNALHSQNSVAQATAQSQAVQQNMSSLVRNTISQWVGTDSNGQTTLPWDGTTNPGAGWCNYTNSATLTAWDTRWQRH